MNRIILNLAVTLDGYIEGLEKEIDWCIFDQEIAREMELFVDSIDTIFFGRKSYEQFIAMQKEPLDSFSKKLNQMQHYVFSSTLSSGTDKVIIVNGDLKENVRKIRERNQKDIWLFGGASLISDFVLNDLIDEYQLAIHPILLGGGKPLFPSNHKRTELELIRSKSYKSGLVMLYYKRRKNI